MTIISSAAIQQLLKQDLIKIAVIELRQDTFLAGDYSFLEREATRLFAQFITAQKMISVEKTPEKDGSSIKYTFSIAIVRPEAWQE